MGKDIFQEFTKAKLQEMIDDVRAGKKEEGKGKNPLLIILAVVGVVAAVALIAYAVYRFLTPDYFDDYDDDDDFDDDFDDAGAEDLEEEAAAEPEAEAEEPAGEEIRTVPDEDAEEE